MIASIFCICIVVMFVCFVVGMIAAFVNFPGELKPVPVMCLPLVIWTLSTEEWWWVGLLIAAPYILYGFYKIETWLRESDCEEDEQEFEEA